MQGIRRDHGVGCNNLRNYSNQLGVRSKQVSLAVECLRAENAGSYCEVDDREN